MSTGPLEEVVVTSASLDGLRGRIERHGDRLDGLGIDRLLL